MSGDVEFEVLSSAANDESVDDDVFRVIAAAFRGDEALRETIDDLRAEYEGGEQG